MTKSIEEQAAIYQEYYSLTPNCGYHFTQGAKARDAQWSAVVNELRNSLDIYANEIKVPERNCSCHLDPPCYDCTEFASLREAEDFRAKADQMLKEMGIK